MCRAIVVLSFLALLEAKGIWAQDGDPPADRSAKQSNLLLKTHLGRQYRAGAVLVIQSTGVLSVPPDRIVIPPSNYSNGVMHALGAVSKALLGGKDIKMLSIGDKVNVKRINLDVKADRITFFVSECDACNGLSEPSSFKAAVVFHFTKGFLSRADFPKVQEIVSRVLAKDKADTAVPAGPDAVFTFVSEENPSDNLQLLSDDTFRLIQKGRGASGRYRWQGLTLTLSQGDKVVSTGHLNGDVLTDDGGKPWNSVNHIDLGSDDASAEKSQQAGTTENVPPKTVEQGQTIEQVVAAFGQPIRIVKLDTKQIYFYKDMKIVFVNGKVSDVE